MEFSTMAEIDPAFIQAPGYRPKLKVIETDEIPVIDLSNDKKEVVLEIGEACKTWGFFQVINHGLPLELLSRIKKTSKEFFDLPMEEKKLAKREEVNPSGYYESEHTKNVRDWKEVFDFMAKDPNLIPASLEPDDTQLRTLRNRWPAHPPEFRDVCEEYAGEVEKLAYKMLELIYLSLGLPGDRLHSCFKDQTSTLRVNHYPACPFPQLALGVGRHKDGGALTVLAQDEVGGLEVRRKSDGAWISVKPVPDAFIINLGDATQVWSNDRYESAEHRVVVNSEKERFSIAFFFTPAHYVMLKPLEELVNEQNPARYREFNWGKFFATRNRSDFKKHEVENIQIYHFRVWSNDRYESAEHRVVVNSEKERFSIPFFFFPAHYVMLKPLKELVNEQNPARYREFNWGMFFVSTNCSDFKKCEVESIQIYHFRIL